MRALRCSTLNSGLYANDARIAAPVICDPLAGPASATCINLSGAEQTYAPDLPYNIGVQYVFIIPGGDTITPRVNFGHVSEQNATLFADPAFGDILRRATSGIANSGWRHDDLTVTLYGTNLSISTMRGVAGRIALRGRAAAIRRHSADADVPDGTRRFAMSADSTAPKMALLPAPVARQAGAWTALAILCFVYVLNFLDRQLFVDSGQPIQDELGVSDGQLGFAGRNTLRRSIVLAIPVGWLADRANRLRVLSLACSLWVPRPPLRVDFRKITQLALSRAWPSVGEAGGVPPSYAIISDYFPSGSRGTAISLFNFRSADWAGSAWHCLRRASIATPAYSWRSAFLAIGVVVSLFLR